MIGGNFNAPNVYWSDDCIASLGTRVSEVLLDRASLRHVLKEPARIRDASCSLFDLLFISTSISAVFLFTIRYLIINWYIFKHDMSVCQFHPAELNVYYDFERADESVIHELEQRFDFYDHGTNVNKM